MELGKRIRTRREELQMSQDELAKKLGYKSRSTINKIELGKNDITQHKIALFAKALQTTPSYLMGWEEINSETEKKNDIISDIVLRLRSDDDFLDISKTIYDMSQEELSAVKNFLSVFKK